MTTTKPKRYRSPLLVSGIVIFLLASCNQSEPVMVNVSPKDMEQTGDRYYGDWEQMEARTVSSLKGYKKTDIPVGRYGDRTDIQFEETGFYYTKKVEGKWWAVSPDGYPLISLGINALNLNLEEKVMNVFNEKYGSPEKWLDETVPMLEKYGFNGAGSWVDVEQVRSYNERNDARFSYCPILYLVTNYKSTLDESRGYNADKKLLPVFGQGFEEYCEMRAGELSEMKDDPNLFGYFFDNELTFSRDMLDLYLELPENEVGYLATIEWLDQKNLSADSPLTDQVRDEFRIYVLNRYLDVTTKAVRRIDPHHMILGSRFYWNDRIYFNDHQSGMLTNPMVFETAGKYVDIVCCNYYFRWTPVPEEINAWTEWSGKPFMITEWYVKGEDSGLLNYSGAGWIVGTQKERGLFYQNYTLQLLESPNCVGWHWFRYQDEGEWGSENSSNKGVVDYNFNPYTAVLDEMKEINSQVYSLRDYFQNL